MGFNQNITVILPIFGLHIARIELQNDYFCIIIPQKLLVNYKK